jgi:hypothetical protein
MACAFLLLEKRRVNELSSQLLQQPQFSPSLKVFCLRHTVVYYIYCTFEICKIIYDSDIDVLLQAYVSRWSPERLDNVC